MAFTDTVSEGDAATADQYNNLRKDVIARNISFATSSGANSSYSITVSQITTLSVGDCFTVKPNHTNTGASTLNVNGVGPESWKSKYGYNYNGGEIKTDRKISVVYNGTDFESVEDNLGALQATLNIQPDSSAQKRLTSAQQTITKNTVSWIATYTIPTDLVLNTLSYWQNDTITTASLVEVAIYTADGKNKVASGVTTDTPSANTVMNIAFSPAKYLKAGSYWIGYVQKRYGASQKYKVDSNDLPVNFSGGSGGRSGVIAFGTISVSGGTMPDSFDSTSVQYDNLGAMQYIIN